MANPRLDPKLLKCLKELDDWLTENSLQLEIIVIGAFALHLLGIHSRATNDIDTISDLSDDKFIERIKEIGIRNGLSERWLNDQASGLDMPDGFEARLKAMDLGRSILARVPARQDMISLKASAYVTRGGEDPKDFSDLKAIAPTRNEIDRAIQFIRKTRSPPHPRFFPDFEEVLRSLYEVIS